MKTQNIINKTVYFFFGSIIYTASILAQNNTEIRIVEDNLVDNFGEGLPGVCVVIKGTATGTISDINGYYRIKAPLGSTLVFSFVGFLSEEMVVTRNNSRPANSTNSMVKYPISQSNKIVQVSSMKNQPAIPDYFIDMFKNNTTPDSSTIMKSVKKTEESYALIQNDWPIFNANNINIDPSKIGNIHIYDNVYYYKHQLRPEGKSPSDLMGISYNSPTKKYVPHISFTHTFIVEDVLKLPELQNQYAQGMFVNGQSMWTNPENGNIFSWGPKVSNLEYDGQVNPFSTRGNLTLLGNGSGILAETYNPLSFFNTGKTEIYHASIYAKVNNKYRYNLNIENTRQQGVIPLSKNNTINLSGEYERLKKTNLKMGFKFTHHNDKLNLEGPSMCRLLRSIYLTPPTFDNLNGHKNKINNMNKSVYLLPDGNQRSAGPGVIDNPYYLIHHSPDKSTSNRINSYLEVNRDIFDFLNFTGQIAYDLQTGNETMGFPALNPLNDSSWYFTRNTNLHHANGNMYLSVDRRYNKFRYKLTAGSLVEVKYLEIRRHSNNIVDNDITNSKHPLENITCSRNTINTKLHANLGYDETYILDVKTNFYYSSTLSKTYTSPAISGAINLDELNFLRHINFLNWLKLRSSWGIFYNEPSLHQSFGRFNSLTTNAADFYSAFPLREVSAEGIMLPEKINKLNVGFDFSVFNNHLRFTADLYKNATYDFMVPEISPDIIQFKNAGVVENKGFDMSLNVQLFDFGSHRLDVDINYSTYTSTVIKVYGKDKTIPIGGFNDTYTVMAEGKPMGAIVGTYYKRNVLDQLVLDSDGYPIIANDKKIIGDPTPDFLTGMSVHYRLEGFAINLTLEMKKGGDIWNGTHNTLSYYGVSAETARQRYTTDFIFPGTFEDGRVNNIPIDYANPENEIDQNIWYRYGETGIGENAIADASWFRMKNIEVNYTIPQYLSNRIQMSAIKFSVFSKNLFLISKYNGVDPESTLWGQDNNIGLDYFNMPTTKSLGIKINLIF